ncbi:ZrgA family zinc uptake protein [Luteibacter sahnii]|uniref:ZrgA family zinc uptake protein n=1 Tax=Luteibacter sahnii TaxID=3021977 RepID=UPI002A6A270F|nr:DUF2796 domain-containing protein [Luteibacter sp. PPL193]MDY1547584.1 DUF2796 domain-containing protein [Luteibacter sp. PPL193]
MRAFLPVFPFLLGAVSLLARAEERHLGPHVHGQASVNVSVDQHAMDVEVRLPGHDAVGFEHPPGSAQERDAVAKATATLKAAAWLVPPQGAGCTLASATVSPHGFGGAAEPGGHADFDAAYRYTCLKPARLDHLEVRLATAFPAVRKVVVNLITADGSDQKVLDGSSSGVDLPQ